MKKPKKIVVEVFTMNSNAYIGIRSGQVITGLRTLTPDTVTEEDFAKYVKASQIDELVTMEVGAGSDILTRPLSKKETLSLATVIAQYKTAVTMAKGWLINRVFDEFRSGK